MRTRAFGLLYNTFRCPHIILSSLSALKETILLKHQFALLQQIKMILIKELYVEKLFSVKDYICVVTNRDSGIRLVAENIYNTQLYCFHL